MATDEAKQPEVTEEADAGVVEAMEQDDKPEENTIEEQNGKESEEKEEEEEKESEEKKAKEQTESKEGKVEEQTESKDADKKEVQAQVITGEKRARKPSFKVLANEELISPLTDRPVRERKTVSRLVASPEMDSSREFHIPKGRGIALKDISGVAHKLARKKNEETLKTLHVILFGRQGKASQLKSNLSQFSGFVWHENEEKQRSKMKEKLDKCVKDKLLEFCDLFDIPAVKATAKKEDLVIQLLDFLAAPHLANNVLHTEDGKSSITKKRSRPAKNNLLESGDAAAKSSSKKPKKIEEGGKVMKESDSESDASHKSGPHNELQNEEREKTEKSVHDGSDDDETGDSGSKEMEHDSGVKSDQESRRVNQSSKRSSTKSSLVEGKPKKVTIAMEESPVTLPKKHSTKKCPADEVEGVKNKETEKSVSNGHEEEVADHSGSKKEEHDSRKKSSEISKKQNKSPISSSAKVTSPVKSKPKKEITATETPLKSPKKTPVQKHSKVNDSSEKSAIVFSRKKKNEAPSSKKPVTPKSTQKENDNKEQAGKKSSAANEEQMNEACSPTEQELRKAIGEILREVDLNKITFLDILKLLGQNFTVDLVPRKSAIKVMVKDELIKLNDEDDDEEEEDEDEESDTEKVESPEAPNPKVKRANSTPGSAGNTTDSEGRCIRSDGRKWRCSKSVMPGTKYCEHHLHRVRKR